MKDIVSESAASYVSILHPDVLPPGSVLDAQHDLDEPPTAFSLPRFIPLLQERIHVINPFTRTFLVSWITLLDSIPDLELVAYLPSFLGGLLKFLSDPNQDVHTTTKVALDRFLAEIKKIAGIKKGIAESRRSHGESARKPSVSSARSGKSARSEDGAASTKGNDEDGTRAEGENENEDGDSAASESLSSTALDEKEDDAGEEWIPGQDVQVDHPKILDILVRFLSESSGKQLRQRLSICVSDKRTEEEIQITTLRWIESFFEICPKDILLFVPRLLSEVLPALSHDVEQVKQSASRVNQALMAYVMSLAEDPNRVVAAPPAQAPSGQQTPATTKESKDADGAERRQSMPPSRTRKTTASPDPADGLKARQEVQTPPPPPAAENAPERSPSPKSSTDLDYEAAVNALTLQFLNEHESTRVAALGWLIMLHKLSPRKVCLQASSFDW